MPATRVNVDVPGSSANLGPGYDCLAIALPLRLRVAVERRPGPLAVEVTGEGAGELPADATNLVAATLLAELDERGDDLQIAIDNRIPLGAGCITGAVQWSNPPRYMVNVIAVGKQPGIVRNAYCDGQGNFCVRYLPEDDYLLWAHDDQAGWRAMPGVTVRSNMTDIGSHPLATGGVITGKVPPRLQRAAGVTVVATDSHGVAIEDPHGWDPIDDHFRISSLWPEKWIVTLKRGGRVEARQTVTLQGIETVTADLVDVKAAEKQ